MNLKNKTVLVTGSSSGIGRATAVACAQKQAVVLVHYRKNEKGAKETLDQVNKFSSGQIFKSDLSNPDNVKQLFVQINKEFKSLDCLINNAGEFASGPFEDLTLWQSQFSNIFFSQVYTAVEFLNTKAAVTPRKIVNISSAYGSLNMGIADAPHYAAAKAAVNSFTCTLAKKVSPDVLVNAIAPGYTWTPNWGEMTEVEKKPFTDLAKIKRFVKADEVAAMAVQLLENDAVTGEIITVDGGLHLQDIL
ncbi:hypothetical protein A2397_02775 [Candidatus Amesbacteria bacterium RIFOXYB1_FULL_44_23]|uniref:Uncharacterized protein n=1 Tax=Candidatus Amesbacteria bacterium RIFOXYB1_FULL_44_23 TaxID=1797263 RepID=A0A1F4ZT13_9BACT|nr:MAG: hypothetical protein A2397_02775 [Candidatus Amesbacteria bacterium RIFOXYB1_FULL_44_23]